MGLIHSRASKKRDKAEAALLEEQRRQLKDDRQEADREVARERAGDNPWRQPTVGDAIAAWRRNRQQ